MPPRTASPDRFDGSRHLILRGRGQSHHVEAFRAPLSVKTVVSGRAVWRTDEHSHLLEPGSYLLINDQQTYWMDMHLSEEGETFCVFFQRGWVEDIVRVTTTSSRRLLEEPEARHAHGFLEITTRDPGVLKAIGDLRTRVITETRGDLEPAILRLGEALVRSETSLRELARRVPALKTSTREELLRRLLRARDYAESSLSSPLALAAVAREAALSSYHLHRSFRQTFGETLHQFITRRRLETAASLLRSGDRSVLEVCATVGFESATSFTTLFRHHYGLPPARFRANSQDSRSHSLPARVRSRA